MANWTEADGTRRRRYVYGLTQAETRGKLDILRRELRLGTISASPSMTVGEYLADWLERDRMRVRASTWEHRDTHVRCYLVPALGRFALASLKSAEIERALASFIRHGRPVTAGDRKRGKQKHNPISPLTARHVRTTLRTALADAVREGLVGRNAAADARPPYAPAGTVAYLAADEVAQLLRGTTARPQGPLYALAVSTGLRLGELLGLGWADVTLTPPELLAADPSLSPGRLVVRRAMAKTHDGFALSEPKTLRSRRTIPLPRVAADALHRRRVAQAADREAAGDAWQNRDGLVFTDTVGRPLQPQRVSALWTKDREAAGVRAVRFHDLRHSAATLMLANGVPMAVISDWLGHAGIAITAKHYAAVVPELHDAAASAMDRALGGVK